MSNTSLPARPSLEQLKNRARELLIAVRNNDCDAVELFVQHHPVRRLENERFALHDAQLVLARQHGFPDWTQLKEEVERRASDFSQRADRFVQDAVDGDFARARRTLDFEPGLARANLWSVLAVGDVSFLRRALERDPGCADRGGGPCGSWTPLLYISFSRFQMEDAESQARFTECARLLLDGGAEPNAAWEHPYWPGSALRSLYGATGVNNNPSLARLLLERGADVNDGESIYHAAQFDHRECMDVLAEFGVSLGRHPHWGNTPLYFLLGTSGGHGDWVATARGIRWLLDHGSDPNISCGEDHETALHVAVREEHDTGILRELLEAGADPNRADKNGVLPLTLAHRAGREDVVAVLKKWGAREVGLTVRERFFEAALSGDRERALTLVRENPELIATFEEKDLLSLNEAAKRGKVEAVRTLLDCGFDIAFKGSGSWGSTPLHIAAWFGQAEMVKFLLSRGSPIDIPASSPVESLPLGWAAHGSRNCRNPNGDYPQVVRALLAAGANPSPDEAGMASPEVAEIIHAARAGRGD